MDSGKLGENAAPANRLSKAMADARQPMVPCPSGEDGLSVGERERLAGLGRSAPSRHLARLRREGLVTTRREARTIRQSPARTEGGAVIGTLCGLYRAPAPARRAAAG